jgi:hypothetical protein
MAAKPRRHRRKPVDRGKIITSIELPPDLHEYARVYAIRHKTSFRAVIEEALRDWLRRKDK